MFKSCKIKSNQKVLGKNKVDIYGAPVFAPDYSTTVLAAKMFLTPNCILCILGFYDFNTLGGTFILGANIG
jgi:hypothetical protein